MTGKFSLLGARLESQYRDLSKIDYISLDVYNDSDDEYMIGLRVISQGKWDAVHVNGGLLKARQWNRLVFDVNPYFFKSTIIQELMFAINGMYGGADEIPFYLDNFRVALYDSELVAPTTTFKTDEAGNTTLVAFDSVEDKKLFNVKTLNLSSACPVQTFELANNIEEIFPDGAYKMEMYDLCYDYMETWYSSSYDLEFTPDIYAKAKNSREIKIDLYNPDIYAKHVTITAIAGEEKKEAVVEVKPGRTATLIFNDDKILKNLDEFYVRVNTWNLGDNRSTIYLSNLRVKI
jgi:hypothetical protein